VLYRVSLRRGAHPAAAAAALALAAWAAEPRFVERPHLVTFLGLALMLLALERAEAGRPRALWALVPAGLVWANANSCFFLAPASLFSYALGNHFRMPSLRPLQEYRPATWPLDGPFFFLAAALVVASLAPGARRWRHLLPAAALACLGAQRIRFVAEFAIVAGPIVAAGATRGAQALAARLKATSPALASAGAAVVVAALLVTTLAPRVDAARRGQPALSLNVEADLIPTAAIRFATESGLRDHMYNDLEVGSYLTWEGWPQHRVFQDPRINGCPEGMHAVLRRADLTRADWQSFLDRFHVTSALISYPTLNPRAAFFDPALWALVYRAADGLVFARRDAHGDVAARELPVTFARVADGTIAERPLENQPPGSPVPACEWSVRLADVYVERGEDARARPLYGRALAGCGAAERHARVALGDLALRQGDPATAAQAYEGDPAPEVRAKRGLALLSLGRPREAFDDLEAARRAQPRDPDVSLALGLTLARLGRRDEARAALEAFLALAPDHLAAARARAALARLR
jgi:tetratricopeptide (TPR) repeat protein